MGPGLHWIKCLLAVERADKATKNRNIKNKTALRKPYYGKIKRTRVTLQPSVLEASHVYCMGISNDVEMSKAAGSFRQTVAISRI